MSAVEHGSGSPKLWGSRFSGVTSKRVEEFTTSLPVDARLWREDIVGSMAHALMLGRQGIIPSADAEAIVRGLGDLAAEFEVRPPAAGGSWEDIHSLVEGLLRERIGEPAGRLHTGRSRNDQVVLDERLFTRSALGEGADLVIDLQAALLSLAREHVDTLLPGYTHLQRAQPVVFGHHLLAYVEMLQRDLGRLQDAYARADVLPLGAGALAGVPYAIDREFVAGALGFTAVSANSMDTVSDRDFMVEHLAALALTAIHLSRLAEELVLWSGAEFGFVQMDDAYATGSSIMPQKKNPDVAELVRGKSGRVIGSLVGLLTMLKGLPLAYNRDLQEDKQGYFDAVDTTHDCLELTAAMVRTLRVDRERMAAAAEGAFGTATDLADFLVTRGVPFRSAHQVVGSIVRFCLEERRELGGLTLEELRRFSALFEPSVVGLDASTSVSARDVAGATAPRRVRAELERADSRLAAGRDWANHVRARLPRPSTLLTLSTSGT